MKRDGTVLSAKGKIGRLIVFILLLFTAIIVLYPIIYIVLGSFKENAELLRGGWNPVPSNFILDNFIKAWKQANFAAYTKNSIAIAVGVTVIILLSSSMAGYVFDRKQFFGSKFIYGLFLAFLFINVGSVSLRPLYELAVATKTNTSLFSIIILSSGTGLATYIFLVRGFMTSLPREIDEAAMIDGCTFFGIYWRMALPMLRPVLATVALLAFRAGWNEYMLPLVFTMSNQSLRPLTVGVTMLKNTGDAAAAWNVMFAGATMSIIPILIVYILFSRYFMEGLTAGAVKG